MFCYNIVINTRQQLYNFPPESTEQLCVAAAEVHSG